MTHHHQETLSLINYSQRSLAGTQPLTVHQLLPSPVVETTTTGFHGGTLPMLLGGAPPFR